MEEAVRRVGERTRREEKAGADAAGEGGESFQQGKQQGQPEAVSTLLRCSAQQLWTATDIERASKTISAARIPQAHSLPTAHQKPKVRQHATPRQYDTK